MVLDIKEAIFAKGGKSEDACENAPSAGDFEHARQDVPFFIVEVVRNLPFFIVEVVRNFT